MKTVLEILEILGWKILKHLSVAKANVSAPECQAAALTPAPSYKVPPKLHILHGASSNPAG